VASCLQLVTCARDVIFLPLCIYLWAALLKQFLTNFDEIFWSGALWDLATIDWNLVVTPLRCICWKF